MDKRGEVDRECVMQLDRIWAQNARRIRSTQIALNAPNSQILTGNMLRLNEDPVIGHFDRLFPLLLSIVSAIELIEAHSYLDLKGMDDATNQIVLLKAFLMRTEELLKEPKKEKYNSTFSEYQHFFSLVQATLSVSIRYGISGRVFPDLDKVITHAFIESLISSQMVAEQSRRTLETLFENMRDMMWAVFTQQEGSAEQTLARIQ